MNFRIPATTYLAIIFTLFCGTLAYSQIEAKAVELFEEKQAKRWNL
jgi:hypothetical protein